MDKEADIRADVVVTDRNEHISAMEPLVLGSGYRHRAMLNDLALDLMQKSTAFKSGLPGPVLENLASLVRSMNCYYSNLIEGHNTHPVDIERVLKNDYSQDAKKRDLQSEAKAHIDVQQWIDEGGLESEPMFREATLCAIHRRFCSLVPESLLWVEDPHTKERVQVVPGALRTRDVQVGSHIAISVGALPRFLQHFAKTYEKLGKAESIIAAAAIHHRFLWMHPFIDGNGRVARLLSHAQLLRLLDTGAVWSVARGLARNVTQYKGLLANCDQPRRNDLDGRGSLSQEALGEFTRFFLETCIDQVNFMAELMQPDRLRARILVWTEEEIRRGALPQRSGNVIHALLYRGELQRSEIDNEVGTGERQARRIVAALTKNGVITSASPRAPIRLKFPAALAHRWLPGLFPEYPG